MSADLNENAQQEELLTRVGQTTKLLHESLRGFVLDISLERAAQRVLNATDAAIPLQESMDSSAKKISVDLQSLATNYAPLEQHQEVTSDTLGFLNLVNANSVETKFEWMNTMMAQEFQDLNGQVIKKVTVIAQNLEEQLVQLLIDYSPNDVKREVADGLLNGPQINLDASVEVVSNQYRADDLRDSLGS